MPLPAPAPVDWIRTGPVFAASAPIVIRRRDRFAPMASADAVAMALSAPLAVMVVEGLVCVATDPEMLTAFATLTSSSPTMSSMVWDSAELSRKYCQPSPSGATNLKPAATLANLRIFEPLPDCSAMMLKGLTAVLT